VSPELQRQLSIIWLAMTIVGLAAAVLMVSEGLSNIRLANRLHRNGAWRRSSMTTIRRHALGAGQALAMLSLLVVPSYAVAALMIWAYLFVLNGVLDYVDWRKILRIVRPIAEAPDRRTSDQ
jgi:hypothetical protein